MSIALGNDCLELEEEMCFYYDTNDANDDNAPPPTPRFPSPLWNYGNNEENLAYLCSLDPQINTLEEKDGFGSSLSLLDDAPLDFEMEEDIIEDGGEDMAESFDYSQPQTPSPNHINDEGSAPVPIALEYPENEYSSSPTPPFDRYDDEVIERALGRGYSENEYSPPPTPRFDNYDDDDDDVFFQDFPFLGRARG